LLRSWRPARPEASAEFNDCVWTRIRRQSAPSVRMLGLSLRAAACWAAALSAFGGSAAAYAYDSLTREERMAAAHARAIDPVQITAAPNTVHRH
jgi:hypothetical protein